MHEALGAQWCCCLPGGLRRGLPEVVGGGAAVSVRPERWLCRCLGNTLLSLWGLLWVSQPEEADFFLLIGSFIVCAVQGRDILSSVSTF